MAINLSTRSLAALFLLGTLAFSACRSQRSRATVQNEEPKDAPSLVSTVRMNDPQAGNQLVNGFYGVENGTWRWTAGSFSVLLRTPPASAQRGATLDFALSVPDPTIEKLGKVRLTATINGTTLNSAEYKAPGPYHFTADVPPGMLSADSVRIDFAIDKTLHLDSDQRVLGLIANSVALTAK